MSSDSDIKNPAQLVSEFKKSGEFDRLRRELLTQFRNGEGIGNFMSRVEDIARQRMTSDMRLRYLGPDAAHAELMQEMDRFPLVERAVAEVPALQNPGFRAAIQKSLRRLVRTEDEEDTSSEEDESEEESSEGEGDVEPSSRAPSPVLNGVALPQEEPASGEVNMPNGTHVDEETTSSDAELEDQRMVPANELVLDQHVSHINEDEHTVVNGSNTPFVVEEKSNSGDAMLLAGR